ncbi:ferritin-like domain-containing protein [Spirosoma sp. HMF4905]|uniref:Ferritin-like domain-containing protein n=1 Tax=Spirosoma arboris TaxID=2682092 RepID=A0A7K1SF19_9BACT|nr:ferritin-like domain-containing protein [Spirosoma arboris]MVM32405.1 ferritin-like domain-containing protein [Spirosoma arboris]
MNLQNILNEIEKVDGEIFDRLAHVSRRGLFSSLTKKTIALAAPAVMASALNKSYGQALPQGVKDVLNFALALEYLEFTFYDYGHNLAMIPTNYKPAFELIRQHEQVHVRLLKSVLGADAIAMPKFDFSAGGIFTDTFTNFATFSAIAQTFEDTGVRAYKGQAGNLQVAKPILQVALQIHATEAAHAANVRYMRGQKGWITGGTAALSGLPSVVDGNYKGEENTVQANVDLAAALAGDNRITPAMVMQAFDEPLDKATVLGLVAPFFAK